MDALAKRGVRLAHAYCTDPLCTPSRGSLWTGLMPHQHGAVTVRGYHNQLSDKALANSVGHTLSRAGYRCAYAGKWHVGRDGPECSIDDRGVNGFEKIGGFDDPNLPGAVERFFGGHQRDQPFLLVASFDDPYNICEWSHDQSLPWGNLPAPPAEDDCPPLPPNFPREPYQPVKVKRRYEQLRDHGLETTMDTASWRSYRWAYFRLVERVDALIGKVLAALDRHGFVDDTIVLFTSDHGEQAGAHELQQKDVLYEESLRVPWIVAGPDIERGRVIETPVSNGLDLMPTLLDIAKVAPTIELPGTSLAGLLRGDSETLDRDSIPFELSGLPNPDGRFTGGSRGVRSAHFKYIVHDQGKICEQLFDLATDPGEMVNLARCTASKADLQEHREMLRRWMRRTGDAFRSGHYGFSLRGLPSMLPGDAYPDKRDTL